MCSLGGTPLPRYWPAGQAAPHSCKASRLQHNKPAHTTSQLPARTRRRPSAKNSRRRGAGEPAPCAATGGNTAKVCWDSTSSSTTAEVGGVGGVGAGAGGHCVRVRILKSAGRLFHSCDLPAGQQYARWSLGNGAQDEARARMNFTWAAGRNAYSQHSAVWAEGQCAGRHACSGKHRC